MSRIRSIAPEQWTDDDFVQMSPLARILTIAVRNEADDNGIFEWNPVKLKMRLLPADNCDIEALLGEMVAHKQVSSYELDGRKFGAVRNFTRFQRPKKPSFWNPPPASEAPGYELHPSYKRPGSPLPSGSSPPPPGSSPPPPPVTVTVTGTGTVAATGDARARDVVAVNDPERVVRRFEALRKELWPQESGFPAPRLTLLSDAKALLEGDAPIDIVLEVLERGMRKAAAEKHPAPGGVRAYRRSIESAILNHRQGGNGSRPHRAEHPPTRNVTWGSPEWKREQEEMGLRTERSSKGGS